MKNRILILILILLSIHSYSQKSVPDFTITDIYGHTHKLYSDYLNQDKFVFLDFFSVGCQSCQEISPVIDTVYRDFGCNYGDVVFLALDVFAYDNYVWEFIQDYNMTFPAVSGNDGGGHDVYYAYGLNYTPYEMLIDNTGKIIIDNPYDYNSISADILRDTMLTYNLKLQTCSGNNFLFYSLLSANDSIVGEINEADKTIQLTMPEGTNLTQLTATFFAESNSIVKINGIPQTSRETVNDFSQGSLIYEITSEDGNTEQWAVSVATSSLSELLNTSVDIYPNPVTTDFFIDINNYKFANIQLEIFNPEGKNIRYFNLTENTSQINISNLPKGIYFLKIKTPEISVLKKIIKL